MTAVAPLLAFVGVPVVQGVAVLAARRVTAWVLRIRGVRFWPGRAVASQQSTALPWWQQAAFVVVGALVSYAVAAGLFAAALRLGGVPPAPDDAPAVVDVVPGMAAETAGIQNGDRIVELAGEPVERWADLPRLVEAHPDEQVEIVVERQGSRQPLTVDVPPAGKIGVTARLEPRKVSWAEAIRRGSARPAAVAVGLVRGLYVWIIGDLEAEVGGPVMIVTETRRGVEQGWARYLNMFGMANTYWGLPFGVVIALITRVRRRPTRT